jgi:large subunit ribosomal protein L10
MTLRLDGKKAIVAEISEVAKQATSVIAAKYAGLTVSELTNLRKAARDSGVYMRVVRNTLARRAFTGTQFECMDAALVGPLVLAFSKEDPAAAARVLKDFVKKYEKLEVHALSMNGVLLPAQDLNRVASLPTRNEAIAQLMAVMIAPITKCVRTIREPHAMLVRVFGAVRDKKQQEA